MNIYAIQRSDGGAVKIGQSRDVRQRLRALQTACDTSLVVKKQFRAGRRVEKALHYLLAAHRQAGEWFNDHEEVWSALDKAERGELWQADDWVPFARELRAAGMPYDSIGQLLGYSREYVRQQLTAGQPKGCGLSSKAKRARTRSKKEVQDMSGIDRIIAAAGGQTALAEVLGVSQQAVSKWQKRGFVPADRVDQLANAFAVEREALIDPALRALIKGE